MAFTNIKITDLPAVANSTEIAPTDVLPIVDIDQDTTKKVTAEQLVQFVNGDLTVGLDQLEQVTGPVFIGREVAGSPAGNVSTLTVTQAKSMIGTYAGVTSGLVPNPPGTSPTSKFLRGDGQWVQPPDSVGLTSISIGATAADVLGVSSNSIITADNPGDNKLIFWDNANSKLTHLSIGSGLEISAGALNATGGGGGATLPAEPTNSIQFNNAGTFGGSSNFTWDGSLSVSGNALITKFSETNKSYISIEDNKTTIETSGSSNKVGIYMSTLNPSAPFLRLETDSDRYVDISHNMRIGVFSGPSNKSKLEWRHATIKTGSVGRPVILDDAPGLGGGELFINESVPYTRMVYKTADTIRGPVLNAIIDDHLQLSVNGTPDTVYAFEAFLVIDNGGSTANTIGLRFDTGATITDFSCVITAPRNDTRKNLIMLSTTDEGVGTELNYSIEPGENINIVTLQGTMKVTTSGIFGIKWYENHGETITLKKGSWLKVNGVI